MSLRTEIRATLEEFAPAAPHLDQEVRDTLRSLQRPVVAAHSAPRLRVSLSLIAAALVVALIGGLVLAGRLFMQSNTPAAPTHVINQAQLKALEAHPLQLPAMAPGASCPEGPTSSAAYGHGGPPVTYGSGPVYSKRGQRSVDSWGTWAAIAFWIDPSASGMILIRARDLVSGDVIVFAADPGLPDAAEGQATLTGGVVGRNYDPFISETVNTYPEAVVDPSMQPSVPWAWLGPGAFIGMPKSASGCIGFQIDMPDFTETYVVNETA